MFSRFGNKISDCFRILIRVLRLLNWNRTVQWNAVLNSANRSAIIHTWIIRYFYVNPICLSTSTLTILPTYVRNVKLTTSNLNGEIDGICKEAALAHELASEPTADERHISASRAPAAWSPNTCHAEKSGDSPTHAQIYLSTARYSANNHILSPLFQRACHSTLRLWP